MASYKTSFRNVVYRSRLEAKWASFFTDLEWEFQYEPFDLNGWVPDFEINTNNDVRLLVEVKPVMFNYNFQHEETFAKAIKYADEYIILMLGVNLFKTDMGKTIGYLIGPGYTLDPDEDGNGHADWAVLKNIDGDYDLSGGVGSWSNIIRNYPNYKYRGYDHKCFLSDNNEMAVEGYWADAHNNTKFDNFKYYK